MTSLAKGTRDGLGWIGILRLGLVQASLGSIVVLTTSTLNRVMVVELALAAAIPGALVSLHYAVQMLRPVWGYESDIGGGRTRWILGGMAMLALSGTGAAASTILLESHFWLGLGAAIVAFAFIGFGIGAAGTSLLALLASRTAPERRPAAATIVWMMMIAGIVVTAVTSGHFLDPYSHAKLITITAVAGVISFVLAAVAVGRLEKRTVEQVTHDNDPNTPKPTFWEALREIWEDPEARLFTIFVFVSMLAYSMQDLILEPFAGLLFNMQPGETTQLSGNQHSGVFLGMATVGIIGSLLAGRKSQLLKMFTVVGCIGSGMALALLAVATSFAPDWPLWLNIFALGYANGAFAVAAIGSMMTLAGAGVKSREGIRMGLWGAAQGIAFGAGGFSGTVTIDFARYLTGDIGISYAWVFSGEAALFLISAVIASRLTMGGPPPSNGAASANGARGDLQPAV
ncbi:BCD family chlorophyll transporter-like MFS transporter [Rhodobium orientis]|uniref:MFS transporter n=1 Tax=Rhodobium orientis TaxID=34017 RepID=A0A327JQU7_9HYPH|nr:BCD family MFS transporter [Rhodobium orientis]MBB4303333.1 BCD family chlorophyll transporter-like MFS transporter [Rhodobium orientis]MBK5951572.1 MFS transporter [Rhodobium orientis]RAI27784.1 MFS transporter [Rhodobium orientis]